MISSLEGREVVLVGGAGGLGSATAELLSSERARLIATYHTHADRARRLEPAATVMSADLTSAADRARVLDAAPALYALVVFPGYPARIADPAETESVMRRSHEINYLGPILIAREAAGRMKSKKTPGSIIVVSTMQANALFPGSAAYASQKAALQHAALILAKECRGPSSIRVNVVSPGVMEAGMALSSIQAGKYKRFIDDGVIPRYGRAHDIARAVRFLIEPDNYITGQVLCVDGGMTL